MDIITNDLLNELGLGGFDDVAVASGVIGDVVVASDVIGDAVVVAKPKDNDANVALHKARYLHYLDEKYINKKKSTSAMLRANGQLFMEILQGKLKPTSKQTWTIKQRKFRVNNNLIKILKF